MNMEKVIGKLYYSVGYSDEAFLCPIILPMIYLGQGVDAKEKNSDDLWYFQDPESYAVIGSAYAEKKSSTPEVNIKVYSFNANEPWPVVDSRGLQKDLEECENRWSKIQGN